MLAFRNGKCYPDFQEKKQLMKLGCERAKNFYKSVFFNGRFLLNSSQLIFINDVLTKTNLCTLDFEKLISSESDDKT